ncbi:beta-ketoacyl-[acyl-carrier-protein] synthase family protein [Maritimibacter sp. UBA3975]|uniref:beta-ketoacyl-[acyl-carrier-protein] synthase family protein n=1 Tax=Maritimibacter sp. UBA3975 TaxID=1946833 RepID=UPI000C0B54F4|nr:beta-ketoacyl-[acyl-carrier-protein] synthase family protein [Maritimibacter sp. UBA3975]MAM60240.1 beta-ACP synthase [Maritimibacter sp.]|tara:strand:- start:10719 stop:11927 length:1209 start_codon:yes stop_codon:yes gene_type:complete
MRRVVITGAGTINPLGATVAGTWDAMRAGRVAIGPLDIPDVHRLAHPIGAAVAGFDPSAHFDPQRLGLLDRFSQFALVAGREATGQAGLGRDPALSPRAGVILGNSGGGMTTQDDGFRAVYEGGRNRVHPFTVPRLMGNAPSAHLTMEFGFTGPSFTVSSACASSNHAIGQAAAMIRAGQADVMLTGGTEAMLTFGGLKAWEGLRVMSPTGCRPFCATRDGMVQGEGAAVFVLEAEEHARARGAQVLANLAGSAMTSDARDIVMPDRDGAAAAMTGALRDAGLAPGDIGYINAHGTGTAANDRTECAAIRQAFGAAADGVAVSSTKSLHGHLIGGAGAVELLACLLALREGVIAPTAGLREADPACDLDIVSGAARPARVAAALSNAFAFGGMNAVLALTTP